MKRNNSQKLVYNKVNNIKINQKNRKHKIFKYKMIFNY